VVTVELIPELAAAARENLRFAGLDGNVQVIASDGSLGYPEKAPYDAISVAAAAPDLPAALMEQLQDPGRMVIPVGPPDDQQLRVITKSGGKIEARTVALCRFVPLKGEQGYPS
jgi:protein-L-isoaspartate(D-aspartate) O-methyltransferase